MAAKKNPARPAASITPNATTEVDEPGTESAPATTKRGRAGREVPVSDVPMCWVSDDDTPEPYLINVTDFDPTKHTSRVTE